MIFKGKRGEKNRQNLIESLRDLTKPEVSDFRFDCITWDGDKPVLKLEGNEETPDFTVTLGSRDDDFGVIVLPQTILNLPCTATKFAGVSSDLHKKYGWVVLQS